MRNKNLARGTAVAVMVALAAGGVTALAQDGKDGSDIQVSESQLRINQRIASAAVKRSNEALSLLSPLTASSPRPGATNGWRTRDVRDGAITKSKLSSALRDETALFASVSATGGLTASRGVTGSQQIAQGEYAVAFERTVTSCASWVQPVGQNAFTLAAPSAVQPNTLVVTTTAAGGDRSNRAFHVMLICP
jgi:hypothetical protein